MNKGLEHPDEKIAKSLGCIIRIDPEMYLHNEKVIVCASLVERDLEGIPHVVRLFGLTTLQKKINFFQHYMELLLEAFVIPLAKFGFAFEPHGQNTLLRIERLSTEQVLDVHHIKGFAVRDFGGVMLHQETWVQQTKLYGYDSRVQSLPSKLRPYTYQLSKSLSECYKVAYHTLFSCHLQRLIRILGISDQAWPMIQEKLKHLIPKNSLLWTEWLEMKKVDSKAFIRMKCDGLYRDYIYEQIPNLLMSD